MTPLAVHMLEHGLIVAVAAPLIVLSRPLPRLLRILPRERARQLVGVLRGPAPRSLLWPPVAFAAFATVQLAFHLTGLFHQALVDEPLHVAEHALFLVTALWLWTVCLAVDPLPRRWPALARAAVLAAAMPVSDIGAVRLMLDGDVAAGGAMALSMMPFGLAAAALAWQGLLREERVHSRRLVREELTHVAG